MNDNLSEEKLIQLGDDYKVLNNLNEAIHCYNKALKLNRQNTDVYIKRGDVFSLKAEKDDAFYWLAIESYRKAIELNPRNEAAHRKLILVSVKVDKLDELTIEYKEKQKKTYENADIYTNMLKEIYLLTLASFEKKKNIKKYAYKPNMAIKILFDFIYLPGVMFFLVLSFTVPKFKGLFSSLVMLLVFYFLYKVVIHFSKK